MSRAAALAASGGAPVLGLRANWRQFWLLVAVNGLVGAMVGLERTVVPLLAEREFGMSSRGAMLSFIASFGLAKALANRFAGRQADRVGRRRVLLWGWILALPAPFLVIAAPSWSWVVVANLFLGVSQGLTWSTTVIMKIDLVGPARRGLAMGLNEFAGYLAVGAAAFATGVIAEHAGLRPAPFYLGIVVAALGLGLTATLVRDTAAHVLAESRAKARAPARSAALFHCSHAGLINNLNDGVAWGLFPVLFAAGGLNLRQVGWLAGIYPLTWGVLQLGTGALSDRWGRKWLIAGGMGVQGVALMMIAVSANPSPWFAGATLLGVGTAMAYPTLLAAVGDAVAPADRAAAVGDYRFWRDLGYVAGALGAGFVSDLAGVPAAIGVTGILTLGSGVAVAARFREAGPQEIR